MISINKTFPVPSVIKNFIPHSFLDFLSSESPDNLKNTEIKNQNTINKNSPNSANKNNQESAPDYNKFKENLQRNKIIQNLPKDAVIYLRVFSFPNEKRIWEKDFTLKRNSVIEKKPDNQDMEIIIHSKYINKINRNNFCEIIQQAKNNGDMAFESHLTTAQLSWKYRSLLRYRKCFGI